MAEAAGGAAAEGAAVRPGDVAAARSAACLCAAMRSAVGGVPRPATTPGTGGGSVMVRAVSASLRRCSALAAARRGFAPRGERASLRRRNAPLSASPPLPLPPTAALASCPRCRARARVADRRAPTPCLGGAAASAGAPGTGGGSEGEACPRLWGRAVPPPRRARRLARMPRPGRAASSVSSAAESAAAWALLLPEAFAPAARDAA